MRILYYDCFSGISGDMNLGAMIDLGVSPDYLEGELNKLNVEGWKLEVKREGRKGIFGTKADVVLVHHHDHDHHGHSHKHDHSHEHVHRNLADIEKIVDSSSLSDAVKSVSKKMFLKIAEAEAKIHNKRLQEIHFHEVGALDSIVDVVGAAVCFDKLGVDRVMASRVELGGGFVKCAHGMMPVPAPATAEILKGLPVKTGAVPFETTTPTGAAILATLVDEFTDSPSFKICKTAYGVGGRDTDIPNVLRVHLAEVDEKKAHDWRVSEAVVVECNLDDMSAELIPPVIARLMEDGADDAWTTPIQMKKGRPAVTLRVLCSAENVDHMKEVLFNHTTTFGMRQYTVSKTMLKRALSKRETEYGYIHIKTGFLNGEKIKLKPEYEDCRKAAEEHDVSILDVYHALHFHEGEV